MGCISHGDVSVMFAYIKKSSLDCSNIYCYQFTATGEIHCKLSAKIMITLHRYAGLSVSFLSADNKNKSQYKFQLFQIIP